MDKLLLIICNVLSCFVIVEILFQFMDERYKRTYSYGLVYIIGKIVITAVMVYVNIINNALLNLACWIVITCAAAVFLFYEEQEKIVRRIMECEAVLLCLTVCEALGAFFLEWILQAMNIKGMNEIMKYCLETAFSKIVVIFLYYILIGRFMKEKSIPYSKSRYGIYCIILIYSLINMFAVTRIFSQGEINYLCLINMGCIVLADMYLLYFVKMDDEKSYFENQTRMLEQQSKLQYEYYFSQTQKYNETLRILHDVDKHIKAIEGLYGTGNESDAGVYASEIRETLKPLIPVKYTGNPILDILFMDKKAEMEENGIDFRIDSGNVLLDFIEPIDVTTIFGNLLDNAIEAAAELEGDRHICIKISSYQQMISVRMENNCGNVKWKGGYPVSQKGEKRGLGLLNVKACIDKYNGSLKFAQDGDLFITEMFLSE